MKNIQPRYISSPEQLKAQVKIQHDINIELTDTNIMCLSCYKGFTNSWKSSESRL